MFSWLCFLLLIIQIFIIAWLIKIQIELDEITQPTKNFIRFLKKLIGEEIIVKTDAGDVTGQLTIVAKDAIQLIESTGDTLLIPVTSINGVTKE